MFNVLWHAYGFSPENPTYFSYIAKEDLFNHMPEKLKRYYNDDWIYPVEERPPAADGVEYGPYWK